MAKGAKQHTLDFTKVKDRGGGNFNRTHKPEGDYRAKVVSVEDAKSSKDDSDMWLFTIKVGAGSYPLYCKFEENQLWKIRNLWVAAGIPVPKKKMKVNAADVVGKEIAVSLGDDEYEGKMRSQIMATFPLSELDDDEGHSDDEDEPEEKPAKAKKKKGKKEKPAPEPEPVKGKKGKGKSKKGDLEELDIDDM